jgi:hypothetical protein
MERKAVRWEKNDDGKPVLVEYAIDQGSSYASGVTRGSMSAGGKHRRGRPSVRPLTPDGGIVPVGRKDHPSETNLKGWQAAVGIRFAKKRRGKPKP